MKTTPSNVAPEMQNVLISIGLSVQHSQDLLDAGFTQVFMTRQQREAQNALYAAEAEKKTPGRDVYRLDRTNNAGVRQADGGEQIFTTKGDPNRKHQEMVSPSELPKRLVKLGYHLAIAEIYQEEGNKTHRKFRTFWSKNSAATVTMDEAQKAVARKYFKIVYRKVFGFRNPAAVSLLGDKDPIQGTIATLNFSGVVEFKPQNTRDCVATDTAGHFECPLRNPTDPVRAFEPPVNPTESPAQAFDRGLNVGTPPGGRCPERTPARFQGRK